MVTLKIEVKTNSFEDAEILIKEVLMSIRNGSQAGIIGGVIGECTFNVDLSVAQPSRALDVCPRCEGAGRYSDIIGMRLCLLCDGTGKRQ